MLLVHDSFFMLLMSLSVKGNKKNQMKYIVYYILVAKWDKAFFCCFQSLQYFFWSMGTPKFLIPYNNIIGIKPVRLFKIRTRYIMHKTEILFYPEDM